MKKRRGTREKPEGKQNRKGKKRGATDLIPSAPATRSITDSPPAPPPPPPPQPNFGSTTSSTALWPWTAPGECLTRASAVGAAASWLAKSIPGGSTRRTPALPPPPPPPGSESTKVRDCTAEVAHTSAGLGSPCRAPALSSSLRRSGPSAAARTPRAKPRQYSSAAGERAAARSSEAVKVVVGSGIEGGRRSNQADSPRRAAREEDEEEEESLPVPWPPPPLPPPPSPSPPKSSALSSSLSAAFFLASALLSSSSRPILTVQGARERNPTSPLSPPRP